MTPIIDLFSGHAVQYRNTRPGYPPELFEYLSKRCAHHENTWDAATGNGQAAIDLVKYFKHVEASDVSHQQIEQAVPHEHISYTVQQSESTNFHDQSFDLVCVFQALHWFDHSSFWKEVKRVLKPNGVFAASGYSWIKTNPAIEKVLQDRIHPYVHAYWAPEARLLWNRYKNIAFPFSNLETTVFNTSIQWNLNDLFGYINSWSATVYCVKEKGNGFLESAYQAFLDVWGDPDQKQEILFDFFTISGIYSAL